MMDFLYALTFIQYLMILTALASQYVMGMSSPFEKRSHVLISFIPVVPFVLIGIFATVAAVNSFRKLK